MNTTIRRSLLAVLGVLIALGIWQGFATRSQVLPTVPETFTKMIQLAQTGPFWTSVAQTLGLWAFGMAMVVLIALPLGAFIGTFPRVRAYTRSTIDFLRSIPHIALLPVALVMLGSGQSMVTVMVIIGAVWPLLIQTISGIDSVDSVTRDSSRVMKLNLWEEFRHVLIPGAMPYVATGLRLSASLALIIVIVSGMLAGTPGLGLSLVHAEEGFQLAELYVYVIVVGLIGLALNAVFQATENRMLHWQNIGAAK